MERNWRNRTVYFYWLTLTQRYKKINKWKFEGYVVHGPRKANILSYNVDETFPESAPFLPIWKWCQKKRKVAGRLPFMSSGKCSLKISTEIFYTWKRSNNQWTIKAICGQGNFRQYIPSKPKKYGIKIFWYLIQVPHFLWKLKYVLDDNLMLHME